VLVDHADALRQRIRRRLQPYRPAVDQDFALVRVVETVEDLHQRAFARAVLAQQGMDLARPDVEADAIVGQDAGEALDDIAHLGSVDTGVAGRKGYA